MFTVVPSDNGSESSSSPSDLVSRGDGGEGKGERGDTRGHNFSPAYEQRQHQQQQPKNQGVTSQNLRFRRKDGDPVVCEDLFHK